MPRAIESILTHALRQPVRRGGAGPAGLPDQATADDIGKLLDALRRMVDFVVVDTSGVFDDHALCALDRSDLIVLVGTLDIPSLKALKLATEHPRSAQLPPSRRGSSSSTAPTARSA